MLFDTWQTEIDSQTKTRLAQMIVALGFRVGHFTETEMVGEKPEVIVDERLVGPFTPKPPSTPPAKPKHVNLPPQPPPESPLEVDEPEQPDTAVATPTQQLPDWRDLYPALASRQDPNLAARANRASRNPVHDHVPYVARMNGIHDRGPGSIDTDIRNTCATSIGCGKCPFGAKCVPCKESERKRLAEMREEVRNNPNGFQPQTRGLLNAIPMIIKMIQGKNLEEILDPSL